MSIHLLLVFNQKTNQITHCTHTFEIWNLIHIYTENQFNYERFVLIQFVWFRRVWKLKPQEMDNF